MHVTKFLGVQIDSELSWVNHIEYTCKKLSKCVAILAKARKKLPKSCLLNLYYSFAYPYFIYCNQVWGSNFRTYLNEMYVLQKKMIRIITSSPYRASTDPLFLANKILNVYEINDYMISIFMYKQINSGIDDFYLKNSSIHNHETRKSDDIRVPSTNSCIREFSIRIKGALTWNSIPKIIRNSKSIYIFKKELKKFLLEKKMLVPVTTN